MAVLQTAYVFWFGQLVSLCKTFISLPDAKKNSDQMDLMLEIKQWTLFLSTKRSSISIEYVVAAYLLSKFVVHVHYTDTDISKPCKEVATYMYSICMSLY